MPIFAPVYYQTENQLSYLARQQRLESKKRKREEDSSDDEGANLQVSVDSDPSRPLPSTAFHPVNKTDPYHIAGHSREESLPSPPFPHAAVKERSKPRKPIDEELAALKPTLYIPPANAEDKSTSLKRRHLDNITTILHRCMLKGDWVRASRAWSLLLRTEVAGRGIDVRRNGRWGIGAEILMRVATQHGRDADDMIPEDIQDASSRVPGHSARNDAQMQFSEQGFKLAREYYERLILQYPHTPYTQHSLNAMAIYPALFNIWIYEVQDRSKQARKRIDSSDSEQTRSSDGSMHSEDSNTDKSRLILPVRAQELDEALPIANRMDELLLSPPYDTSSTLLQLRGMVAMWISDLHADLAGVAEQGAMESDVSSMTSADLMTDAGQHQAQSRASLKRAHNLFSRLKSSGTQLPQEALNVLAEDDE
jgi:hypothetical protein